MTVTPPPIAPPSYPAAASRKSSALAVVALILGICGIVPCLGVLLGVAGIVLGIVALARNAGGRAFAIAGIVTGLFGLVIGQVLVMNTLVRPLRRTRGQAWRTPCGRNLSAIGKGIAMYATENNDACPPDLDVLVRQGRVPRRRVQCPSAPQYRRRDYFYLAPSGDPADVPGDSLVACDLRGYHRRARNVLYAPGNMTRLTEVEFQAELAKPVNAAFAAALRKAEGE